ncbi:MAG: DUF502 domain-containing protein [Candidatus Latescibacterota bacterium]|nr:MAG: DUF502 domain-containing protein [Candidatus Latescibacterota bacterium]
MKFLRRHFLTGLLVIAPTVFTGWLVWKIFVTIDNLIAPFQKRFPIIDIPGIGFVVVLLLILIVGILASNLIGRRFIAGGERLLNRLPLIRRIYNASKELSEVFLTDKKTVFQRVVMIRYPHADSFALAFVTNSGRGYFSTVVGEELISVFIPTTPNPTSGFLLMIPEREVFPVDVSVEEAMKIVISGGAFTPQLLDSRSVSTSGGDR